MRTSIFAIGASALAFMGTFAVGELTSDEIVDTIDSLKTDTAALQSIAATINFVNEIDYLLGRGPVPALIDGFNNLGTTTNLTNTRILGTDPFEDEEEADAVEDAFGVFASALQTVLYTMDSKAALFRLVPAIGGDLIKSLRGLEAALNTFATHLKDVVANFEEQVEFMETFINDLDHLIDTTVDTFNGISIS
ncbi:hypothetical protein GE09DRAFT_495112 [Coniochaeta sp. 2T2.1]|nr:hypothetical protein GE09DRAFT_495112 [Coniochaeta sp. 2T2.1]